MTQPVCAPQEEEMIIDDLIVVANQESQLSKQAVSPITRSNKYQKEVE